MAKKRDLLNTDYNPVAEQIRRYRDSVESAEQSAPASQSDPGPDASTPGGVLVSRPESPALPSDLAPSLPEDHRREQRFTRQQAARPLSPRDAMSSEDEALTGLAADQVDVSEVLTTSLRTRVSADEHRHWVDTCLRLTGKQNHFSAIVRALLILVENALDPLEKRQHELQRMRVPPRNDRLANAMYEYQLAEILYEAIASAGRPKPPGLLRQKR